MKFSHPVLVFHGDFEGFYDSPRLFWRSLARVKLKIWLSILPFPAASIREKLYSFPCIKDIRPDPHSQTFLSKIHSNELETDKPLFVIGIRGICSETDTRIRWLF